MLFSRSRVNTGFAVLVCVLAGSAVFTPRVGAQVVINEVVGSNGDSLRDADGDAPDWLELFNAGASGLNLENYGLSDGPVLHKWVFPRVIIPAGGHLVIFASGKDRRDTAAHWETVIDHGDVWSYIVPTSEPASSWRLPGFNDASWSRGRTGIGYGDGDDRTNVPSGTISVYARKTFQLDDPGAVTHAFLDIDFDDGFVAFLNGREIARENLVDRGRPPAFNETADGFTEPRMTSGRSPLNYPLVDPASLLRRGENVLAIQVHNSSSGSSDLSLIPFFTLGLEDAPAGARGVAGVLRPNLPAMHTNFKIDADGEVLVLSTPDEMVVDSVRTGYLPTDISLGRFPDGASALSYHPDPTPGAPNASAGFASIGARTEFSAVGGFHDAPFDLTLSKEDPVGSIHYTLDGSVPTEASPVYRSSIRIASTTVVRARVLGAGAIPGPAATHTYFVRQTFRLPVVSISTDPANFFDNDTGIYVLGDQYNRDFPHFGANFWEDWERPVHLELYETDGRLGFSADLGAKIFGGWSRGHPQRSMSFFARKQYGTGRVRYRIFPQKKIDSFEAFVLRNSGNDWNRTHFRDAMMTSLLDDLEVDRQAYRPAVVFINGDYWGILNLREKVNEHFIDSNHKGVDSDNIDLLERNATTLHGDADHYQSLIGLLNSRDVRDPAVYTQVASMMDIPNFIDYQASQIYFDNTDWPGNNIKFWRPRTADGRWRWIMFDTDFGFGIWNVNNHANNTLAFALEPNGPNWPNPPWSTLMLRRLVTSEEFVAEFVNRFATHLNTIFTTSKVVARINEMEAALAPEMGRHHARWGGNISNWRSQVNNMRVFASRRAAAVRSHLASRFRLGALASLRLDVSPPRTGFIEIHDLPIWDFPWAGAYFRGLPIRIAARPVPGFRFVGWEGVTPDDVAEASVELTGANTRVSAFFEIDCSATGPVVINEINYNAPDGSDPGDWVELHNQSLEEVDISGWTLRDESDERGFTIPDGTRMAARSYLVLCSDLAAFTALFPGVRDAIGDLGFSLEGGGESVRLFDATGDLADSLVFDDESPWPEDADGRGATIALRNPVLDNTHPPHWAASPAGGTPGASNDIFEEVEWSCVGGGVRFVRGDCNDDGTIDISDARCILSWLFGGRPLTCLAAADPNGDAVIDISDAIGLLTFLFIDGPPPREPSPRCGPRALEDLECEESSCR